MLTPEQFSEEVGRRVIALASQQAAAQGSRLTKRDRDTLRVGAVMAAPVTFTLIREESLKAKAEQPKDPCQACAAGDVGVFTQLPHTCGQDEGGDRG